MHFCNIFAEEISEYVFKNKKYVLLHMKINIETYHGDYTVPSQNARDECIPGNE
jgi:hypothetical protein